MQKGNFFKVAAVVAVLVIGAGMISLATLRQSFSTLPVVSLSQPSFQDRQMISAQLGHQPLELEVVTSRASITQGLSGRSEIGSDGMLFIMGRTQIPRFWMKDMLFDLDMIWILDNKVVDITRRVPNPEPGTPDSALPTYPSSVPANQVLEVPAGSVETWGIVVGDQLEFK